MDYFYFLGISYSKSLIYINNNIMLCGIPLKINFKLDTSRYRRNTHCYRIHKYTSSFWNVHDTHYRNAEGEQSFLVPVKEGKERNEPTSPRMYNGMAPCRRLDKTKVKQYRRDFRKGNYKEIRKHLTHVDWKNKMKNKTATECWTILRSVLDSAIDRYVPMKKQGKRSKKKYL